MTDAIVGRILVLVIGIAVSIWFVRGLSWEDKFDRFILRMFAVMAIIRLVGTFAFDWFGLFPID